jgi:hypothetical protein
MVSNVDIDNGKVMEMIISDDTSYFSSSVGFVNKAKLFMAEFRFGSTIIHKEYKEYNFIEDETITIATKIEHTFSRYDPSTWSLRSKENWKAWVTFTLGQRDTEIQIKKDIVPLTYEEFLASIKGGGFHFSFGSSVACKDINTKTSVDISSNVADMGATCTNCVSVGDVENNQGDNFVVTIIAAVTGGGLGFVVVLVIFAILLTVIICFFKKKKKRKVVSKFVVYENAYRKTELQKVMNDLFDKMNESTDFDDTIKIDVFSEEDNNIFVI